MAKAEPRTVCPPTFKRVVEVFNSDLYQYTIVDTLSNELTYLNHYVFVVRCRLDRDTKETIYYIDINSESLRKILRTVLRRVDGSSLDEAELSVEQHLLYHLLPELDQIQFWNDVYPTDYTSKEHFQLLVDYIKDTYEATARHLHTLLQSRQITYDLLWALFKPNAHVYTTCSGTGRPRCVKYNFGEQGKTKSGSKHWKIDCSYLDFDGTNLGEASIVVKIAKFRGVRQIDHLPAFPLQYHANASEVKADLLQCGKKFLRLIGTHHRYCNGQAFIMHKGNEIRFPVNGRIMVDAAFFRKRNPNYGIPEVDRNNPPRDTQLQPKQVRGTGLEPANVTEDDLLISSPTVPGFSFGEKRWAEFPVTGISEIQWSSTPYDCLTLPMEQKETIIALAEARTNVANGFEFDDFIAGKGRSLVVLLHGPPGVGKTLTAEAVAEHLRRPLYSISAGELDIIPSLLEEQLSDIFQIASYWNAILLLDEADVYLEQRSFQDLTRNSLVTVFLRKLEYLDGIMFLTTNRVSDFDEAILSRIHLMMKYDDLTRDARMQIWRHFLAQSCTAHGAPEVRDNELEQLVRNKLNGRQIKNAVSTAHALATKEKCRIKFTHLSKAVTVSKDFMCEFTKAENLNKMYS